MLDCWRGLESSGKLSLGPHASQLLHRCYHIPLGFCVPLPLAAVSPEVPLFVTVVARTTYLHLGLCVCRLSGLSRSTCSRSMDCSSWVWLCCHDHCRLIWVIVIAHCFCRLIWVIVIAQMFFHYYNRRL
eukprot:jgi/Botrbrau1/874/Bobra.0352s0063.1